jgi:hypothetical protein
LAKVGIVALLAAMLAIPAALYVIPVVQATSDRTAWLKIVTPSWNGVVCPGAPVTSTPQMRACPSTAFLGFADRYNLTGQWYFVEVYQERGAPFNDVVRYPQTFYPNGTGFVQIRWPQDWANLTVVVKAKSYDGTEVGAGTLYDGIIVYMLVVNASPAYLSAKFGLPGATRQNATILLDGERYAVSFGQNWAELLGASDSRAGPVDSLALHPNQFATAFSDPRNAWVANASVIFTPFHVHTWYSVKDNLSYAQVKIYEMNVTADSSTSTRTLIRAFVTKGDGSGYGLYDPRTTNEMYPAHGRYANNELIPIPLQAVNWKVKIPYRTTGFPTALRAHLNVTVRVWWETVLVNTTFFAGRDTGGFTTLGDTEFLTASPDLRDGIPTGDFYAGTTPLLEAFNLNYNYTTVPYVSGGHSVPLAIFLNSTVFYWRCGVRDDDLLVDGYDFGVGFVGSALFDAQCLVNLRDETFNPYYLTHQRATTGELWIGIDGEYYALGDDPHDWPGYLPEFREYMRVPNATAWSGLLAKYAGITVFADNRRATDEVYTSRYYKDTDDLVTNDPRKVAVNTYLKTRSISDDPGPYRGIRLEVLYAGGYKNLYLGSKQSVGVYTLENPYLVAIKGLTWIDPFATPSNYPEIIDWYPSPVDREVKLGTTESGAPIVGIVDSNTVSITDPIFGPITYSLDGKLLVVANVSDIVFVVYDQQGSLLTPPQTQIYLHRETGSTVQLRWYRLYFITPTAAFYIREDEFVPFLYYIIVDLDLFPDPDNPPAYIAVAYQVPENLMYGVTVKFDGVTVYENEGEIPKLIETVYRPITVNVFKLKVLFVDCQDRPLAQTPFYMIDLATNSEVRFNTGSDGARDFVVAGGPDKPLTFTRLYWKGVDVPFLEAILPDGTRIPATNGKVSIPLSGDIRAPVKVKALIEDIKFKTFDYQGTFAIPRLNITVSWVGYNISDPLRRAWYFLETMDPRPYAIPDGTLAERLGVTGVLTGDQFDARRWNTSVRVAQFFSYVIRHDNATNEYIFYQMPPAIYNITVTTVVPTGAAQSASPGYGFWPGETGDRPYESTIVWRPGSSSVLPRESHVGALTRVVLREFNVDLRFTQCGVVNVDLRTWALHWYLEMIDSDLKIGDVSFDIINDNFVSMTLGLRNSTRWDKLTLEYKSVLYGNNFRPGPQDYSYLWWNGSYRLVEVRLTTNMSFTVDKFFNKTALPNKVWPALNFTLQPNLTLFQQQRTYSKWVSLNASFGYKITIYDKDTLRAPLPVTFVKPKAIDKGGAPLENALIEAWILDLDLNSRLRIDTANTGSGSAGGLMVSWAWEMKRVADPDTPQRFRLVRWDRVHLSLTPVVAPPAGEEVDYRDGDTFDDVGLDTGVTVRFDTTAVISTGSTGLTLLFHTPAVLTSEFEELVITVAAGQTVAIGPDFDELAIPAGTIVTIVDVTDPTEVEFNIDGTLTILPTDVPTPQPVNIFVQVPPYPAKLYLRNVIGDYDLVVTAREVILLIDNATARDNNVGEDTPMGTPDGLLKYERWYTRSDGLIKSFTIPGYEGLLLLPTSGWLNETFHDGDATTKDEFHYQFNVVWKSAVVYSDNFVLDKKIEEFGASEVYDVRFMFTLSNSTDPAHAVRNLNLWIYYPNVTTWWEQDLWHTVPPSPQDYEACSDSAFPCEKRVTLISSADADGVVEFSKIPGPRFMNTTWKYVFSANHSDVSWLKDLVATQFVLNNETFGDGKLKEVSKSAIDVPIMLNAAKQLSVVLLTWRDEQGVPTAYPIQGYTVKLQARRLGTPVDTGVLTAVSDALGFATFNSDPTDVRKVFWAGLTIRYRVEPPAYVNEPDDTKWRDWMRNFNVQLVEQAYNTPTRRSSFAYFPDEEPTHWAITTISTTFDPDGFCIGLCTYFDKEQGRTVSKPFVITVNYAAVTVRAIDFNGRPLAGAFVELVDRASGRIAAWSYTANTSWTARPIDIQELFMFHRGKLLDPRPIGGAGYTAIMNLTFGKWNYDANNDDTVDASGVRNPLQMIIRVYWLSNDPTPNNAVGNLLPVWPFRDETAPLPRHVKVYDSDFDETDAAAKTLVVPHSEAAFGIRLPDRTISASDPVSRGVHRDVTTAVFDFKALLNYAGKTLPDEILKRLEVFVYKKVGVTTELSLRFTEGVGMTQGTFTINRLPRGVYEIEVRFAALPERIIFKRTFDISTVNVGTVQVEASLPFTDLSFEVTDLKGRPLTIAPGDVSIEPAAYYFRREVAGNVITITALYTGAPVTITVKYSSPTYGTSVQVTLTDTAEGIRTRLIGGRTLQLPVDDVVITAVDAQGRPVGGAVVTFKGVTKTTGSDGKAVFERVPLGTEDAPIAYNVRVSVEGVEVYNKDEPISVARKEISVLAQLFALTVRVVGDLGQGLQGASVQLLRAGTTVATGSADSAGAVRFERLAPASYEVRAQYKGFSGTATVSLDALRRGEVVEIRLPVYVEVLGIPMSLATLLALVIGIILLVIVLAIIISEYRWWRGRRLGVYAPPPPKAPAK